MLIGADRRTRGSSSAAETGISVTFEEYRYDAMGRRIWVRSRKACYGHAVHTMCNLSLVRRTVWDGDRELYEIQMPAWEDTPVSTIEDDFAAPEEEVHHPFYLEDRNPFFGRVAYTYGHGIDRPLSVVRMGYRDLAMTPYVEVQSPWRTHVQPFAILPLWDAHGNIDGAVLSVNGVVNGGRTKCEMWRSRLYCIKIDWAESFFAYDRPRYQRWHWHGTLLEDKRNETGTYYRRNRTYDPSTGRFTQEDPIGLAGGLNVYGFADGDPVSYDDPYGLSAQCNPPTPDCIVGQRIREEWAAISRLGESFRRFVMRESAIQLVTMGAGPMVRVGGLAVTESRILQPIATRMYNQLRHVDSRHLAIARRELRGASTGWDHVTEVREAASGLRNTARSLRGFLSNPNLTDEAREVATHLMRTASVVRPKSLLLSRLYRECAGRTRSRRRAWGNGCGSVCRP